jgi:glycosyltransferase involved in cell wall biosynthesis
MENRDTTDRERGMKRIAVISEDLAEPWDEGIKKFAYSVGSALGKVHHVVLFNVDRSGVAGAAAHRIPSSRTFTHPMLRRALRALSPDIVLYIPSPSSTLASFLRAYALRRHVPGAAHGMVALIPRHHRALLRPILHGTAPDVVFVPSYASLLRLHKLSLRSEIVPAGVDTSVFHAPTSEERSSLRASYGFGANTYIYLHVGHLSPKRNLGCLASLRAGPDVEVVVVGSTSTQADRAVQRDLEEAGVRVVRTHVPVEQYYRLADCYVFPVRDHEGCVEIPLSVFEALASGLPVVTTPFGGLRDFLQPGADVHYCETDEELLAKAASLREGPRPEVRPMEAFAWSHVADRIMDALTR